jgi:NADH dehydrogenase [ubiquinone] 1 alpha subcomplex assembly factor 1
MLITDFSNFARQQWIIVNDGVMGGKSSSRFQINSFGNGVFMGNISLENNGGFASVKNHEPLNLTGYDKILLTVIGDGKRYSFRLQTGTGGNADEWSYEHTFVTKNKEWSTVELNLHRFEPTYRGRTIEDAPPLNPENIMRYGFLISDKQQGSFRLEIEKIEAVKFSEDKPFVKMAAESTQTKGKGPK